MIGKQRPEQENVPIRILLAADEDAGDEAGNGDEGSEQKKD